MGGYRIVNNTKEIEDPQSVIDSLKSGRSLKNQDLLILTQTLHGNPDIIPKLKDIKFYQLILAKKRNLRNKKLVITYLDFILMSKMYIDFWHLIQKVRHDKEIDLEKDPIKKLFPMSPREEYFIKLLEKVLQDPKFSTIKICYDIISAKTEWSPQSELLDKGGLFNYANAKFGEISPEIMFFLCWFFVDLEKEGHNPSMVLEIIHEYFQDFRSTGKTRVPEDPSLEAEKIYSLIQVGNRQELSRYVSQCIQTENTKPNPDHLKLGVLNYLLGNFSEMEAVINKGIRECEASPTLVSPGLKKSKIFKKKSKNHNNLSGKTQDGRKSRLEFLKNLVTVEKKLNSSIYPQKPSELGENLFHWLGEGFDSESDLDDDSDIIGFFPMTEFLNHYMNFTMFLMLLEEIDKEGFQEKSLQDLDLGEKSRFSQEWGVIFQLWREIIKDPTLTIHVQDYAKKMHEILSQNPLFQGITHVLSNAFEKSSRLYDFFNWQVESNNSGVDPFELEEDLLKNIISKAEEGILYEFKREIHVETLESKAEFIRDMISLGNMALRERRKAYLIVGVSRSGSVLEITNPNLCDDATYQQIIKSYVDPKMEFASRSFSFNANKIPVFVLSPQGEIPYSVQKVLNSQAKKDSKKQVSLNEGQSWIRDGSSKREITVGELKRLCAKIAKSSG